MSTNSLSLDDIATLLGDNSIRPKPRQVGPLKYLTELGAKCSICGTSCMIEVNSIAYCTSHALYALNYLLLEIENAFHPVKMCNCTAGIKTMYSLHTADCAIYDSLPSK